MRKTRLQSAPVLPTDRNTQRTRQRASTVSYKESSSEEESEISSSPPSSSSSSERQNEDQDKNVLSIPNIEDQDFSDDGESSSNEDTNNKNNLRKIHSTKTTTTTTSKQQQHPTITKYFSQSTSKANLKTLR